MEKTNFLPLGSVKEFFPLGFVTRYIKHSATVEVSNANNNDFFKSGKDQFFCEKHA